MSTATWYLIAAAAGLAVFIVVAVAVLLRRRLHMDPNRFQEEWREMQKLCASKETWRQAVIDADKILDRALRKRRMRGKTEGERLTKAQRLLTDNEGVWFGHKLRLKIDAEPDTRLKEKEVKDALIGIRQALKDLGALSDGK